jgi:hypothetical protein
MKRSNAFFAAVTGISLFCVWLIFPVSIHCALLYKSYIVRQDGGNDILCDPYIVQKNDWVFKLFKQKGEIAHDDFPKFLSIFQRINPHVHDINTIRPGQHIFIPLKQLKPGTLPGQSSGIVTIPFVTISRISDILKKYSTRYVVKKGDCVSRLVAQKFGSYGSQSYQEGIKLFKLNNPDISDINRIYADQMIYLPDPSLKNQSWYQSLFDDSGNIRDEAIESDSPPPPDVMTASGPIVPSEKSTNSDSAFSTAASILDAKLFNKGVYFFPGQRGKDIALDLSEFPVLETKEGMKILFSGDDRIQKADLEVIKNFWKDLKVAPISKGASAEQVLDSTFKLLGKDISKDRLSFSDHGVEVNIQARWIMANPAMGEDAVRHDCITLIETNEERMPDSISRYLEQHDIIIRDMLRSNKNACQGPDIQRYKIPGKNVIALSAPDRKIQMKELLQAMGYHYSENISITFPYAGIQIQAISNIISAPNGKEIIVDFGELYGDAVHIIEKTGITVIQIRPEDDLISAVPSVLNAMGVSFEHDPVFFAAKRPPVYNASFTIPGILVENTGKFSTLVANAPLPNDIVQFLEEQGLKIIMIE